MPLQLRGSSFVFISDAPKASFEDVSYALSCFLVTVTTKNSSTPTAGPVRLSFADDDLELPRSLTFATPHEGKTSTEEVPESLYCAAYLGKTRFSGTVTSSSAENYSFLATRGLA